MGTMSSDESDTVQELYESFQELSQEEARELFEKTWFGTDREDEWRLNPPWGGLNPPRGGLNPRMTSYSQWPGQDWPPRWPRPWPWPDLPGSPGPTFPDFPDFPESPISQRSALGLQSTRQPTASIRLTAQSGVREEDSEEIYVDVDITTDGYEDPDQIRTAGGLWGRIVETGAKIARDMVGGGGNGGGITIENVTIRNCDMHFENVTIQK